MMNLLIYDRLNRNKKDPRRGRKRQYFIQVEKDYNSIETKKIPVGDGNVLVPILKKQDLHIETKKIPVGDGNPLTPCHSVFVR